jgi:hypothetical protein
MFNIPVSALRSMLAIYETSLDTNDESVQNNLSHLTLCLQIIYYYKPPSMFLS